MNADKFDGGKPDYSLLPKVFCDQVAYVMMYGATKYGAGNYLKGHRLTQLTAAAGRHLKELEEGNDVDEETGLTHAAQVCANMLMLMHQQQIGTLKDDRRINAT